MKKQMVLIKSSAHALQMFLILLLVSNCNNQHKSQSAKTNSGAFPSELVAFTPYPSKPVFKAADQGAWDKKIRERGYILYEDSSYKLWHTGYNGDDTIVKHLGYATSP